MRRRSTQPTAHRTDNRPDRPATLPASQATSGAGPAREARQVARQASSSEAALRRAERLGFQVERITGAALPGPERAPGPGPASVQRVLDVRGFEAADARKHRDLLTALNNSGNRHLNFLITSDYGAARIDLDPTADPNPGDCNFIYKKTTGDGWEYATLETLRARATIGGIGAFVKIRKWFFDRYSTGQILSMVAHEAGVHLVPYLDEMMAKLPAAAHAPVDPGAIDTGRQSGERGVEDHRRVADVRLVDFQLYRGVVNSLIEAVVHAEPGAAGQAKADDLADAYLMDLATFSRTGQRVKIPLGASGIAARYNQFREETRLQARTPRKTAMRVLSAYRTLYSRVLPVVAQAYPRLARFVRYVTYLLAAYLVYWLFGLGKLLLR